MGLARKIALGAGDFGFNLYWQTASLYLLFFLYRRARPAGRHRRRAPSYWPALIVDVGARSLLMGLLADRTPQPLRSATVLSAVRRHPAGPAVRGHVRRPAGGDGASVAFAAITHIAFRTIYAVISIRIPRCSRASPATSQVRHQPHRVPHGLRHPGGGGGGRRRPCRWMKRPCRRPESPRHGWVVAGVAFGLLATLILLLVAWATKAL